MEKHTVSHEGIVQRAADHTVFVRIISKSACANCHAKSVCLSGESGEKIIEAYSEELLSPGDTVNVEMEEKLGWIALVLMFLVPFIILAGTILILFEKTRNDALSGLCGIAALAPYYLLLFACRTKLAKKFVFKAVRINNS